MTVPDIQRKVRQHDNELVAIYEILTDHGKDLREIKVTLAGHSAKLEDHGRTLAEHGRKLDDFGAKLDEVLALLRGR